VSTVAYPCAASAEVAVTWSPSVRGTRRVAPSRAAQRRAAATRAGAPGPLPSTTTATRADGWGGGSGDADNPAARPAMAATSRRVIRMNVLRMITTVKPPRARPGGGAAPRSGRRALRPAAAPWSRAR